ncbi:hypothetical protein RB195_008614 [Necator americanus]|uniref:EGF-like domain-containing protein n=1 Tax=Necator americanus TaxID=51031 RepID=A0ABR1CQQ1_NECAM
MGWIKILIAALFVVVWRANAQGSVGCGIGGFLLPNGTCVCHRFWTGDNCNETVCINGGYSPDNKVCICPTGYLGPHCDAVTTSRPSVSTFAKRLTFNTVIYNAFSDYWGRAGFAKFKESVNNHLEKFNYTQYNIAVFTEDNPNGFKTTNTSSSKEVFLATLHSQNPIYPKSYGCTNQPFYALMYDYIKSLKLRDTALTVVTQFPPISDDTARDELQRLASAFNVRINVIWISDEIYVRCLFDNVNKQYDEFSHIAFNTGGLFVPQMYDKDDKPLLTDVVIASHYQYQSVGFGAFGDCSSVRRSFSWQADPQPIPTYLVVEGADVSMRGCPMMELPNKLSSGQRIFNVTTSRQRCTLILSNKSGHCSAKVFLSDVSNTGVRLYSSFVEDPVIDSSSYRPTTSNKFYITMRAEVNSDTYSIQPFTSTVYSSEGQPKEIVIVNRTDVATFTFVTDDSFVCNATGGCQWWWAEVRFSVIQKGNDTVQYMQRSIPFKCYTDNSADGTTIGSTLSTKPSTTIFTTVGSTSSTIMDSTVTTTGSATSSTITSSGGGDTTSSTSKTTVTTPKVPKNFPQDNPSTFAYGFANTLPEYYYETFFVASLNNVTSLFGNYGMIRFEVSNANAVVYHPEDTLADFTNDVYNTYAWGKISSSLQYVDSQVLDALVKVTSSKNLYENSLVSFCVDKLPTAAQFTTQYGTVPYSSLVNKNVKTLFFLDRKTLDREIGYQRTSGPLSEIAASTNGHLIISDQSDQTDFLALLQMLYTQGPSQSLLFARSVNPSQKLTSLGTIDIGQPINVTITVTTSVYNSSDLRPLDISLMFVGSDNETVNTTLFYTKASNFYANTVLLKPQTMNVFFDMADSDKDIHIRMWIPRSNQRLKVGYADLTDKILSTGPDTINGAAVRATVFGGVQPTNLSIEIRGCAGNQVKLFDRKQWTLMTAAGDAFFVPYFCTSDNSPIQDCPAGTQNKYDVQFTGDNGLSEMRSFACSQSQMSILASCQQQDSDGNYECIGDRAPFYRGPTAVVKDCSRHGRLYYDVQTTNYTCECDPGYTGESCEIGICQEKNTPDEADTRYRTYTVIIGVDKYGIESLLLDDAAIFARPKQEPTTIWRYQLILYCSNGNVLPLYIGGNFTDFNAAMSSRTGFCSQVKDDEFNLANIYRAAVTGLGRFVRGMIIFYNEAPYLMNVDLEEFIAISKVYRQELFIYAVDPEYPGHSVVYKNFNDVRDAAYITGGNILFGDFNDDGEPQPMNAYTEMLSSDVSLTVHANRQTGRVSAFIDSGATGYVFVSNQDQSLIGVRNANGASVSPIPVGKFSSVYKLNGNSMYTILCSSQDDYSISVVVLNGLTPAFSIVDERTDDANTALASPNRTTGPSIVFTMSNGWKVQNNADKNYRVASRQSCTFGYDTFTVFSSMKNAVNFITVTLTNGTSALQRALPIPSTSAVDCQNGGYEKVDRCSCPIGFSAPDCSRPVCQTGTLNTWGDVCNSDLWPYGGRFCQAPSPN